jgi:hypothetical protein
LVCPKPPPAALPGSGEEKLMNRYFLKVDSEDKPLVMFLLEIADQAEERTEQ